MSIEVSTVKTNLVEGVSRKLRSGVSNGTRQLFTDGRSSGARRFRDLCAAFGAEVGGFASLPASGQQLVRRLAQVSVELELLEAQRASGAAIDPVAFVTLVNSQRRLVRDLGAYQHKAVPPSLADILAEMETEKAVAVQTP